LGLGELRVKESDRLGAMARGLAACGADVKEGPDWLAVTGNGTAPTGGTSLAVNLDHRPAMSFLVMGLAARKAIRLDDGTPIDTSSPGFVDRMNGIGAGIRPDVQRPA